MYHGKSKCLVSMKKREEKSKIESENEYDEQAAN